MHQFSAKGFDSATFLGFIRPEKKTVCFPEKQINFSEGNAAIRFSTSRSGIVKLTVTFRQGKEEIIGVFSRGDFLGESCIASDQPVRLHNAVALTKQTSQFSKTSSREATNRR